MYTALKEGYVNSIKEIEEIFGYKDFSLFDLNPADLDSNPMVLLIGPHSVGKTSFVEWFMGKAYPGQRIGPEPTTDRFTAIMHGNDEKIIPGGSAILNKDFPFSGLEQFGDGFLQRFECVFSNSPVLKDVTFIDTPGILAGEKQRSGRTYNYLEIIEWFYKKSDLILIFFDAHRLDISDELKDALEIVKDHSNIKVVLNKVTSIKPENLLSVHGALMWSLGKALQSPEVVEVFPGSFRVDEEQLDDDKQALLDLLFQKKTEKLISELENLKDNSYLRKIGQITEQLKSLRIHIFIIDYLGSEMPSVIGQKKKKDSLIRDLDQHFEIIATRYGLDLNILDFPDPDHYRRILPTSHFTQFPRVRENHIQAIDDMLYRTLPKLMEMISANLFS